MLELVKNKQGTRKIVTKTTKREKKINSKNKTQKDDKNMNQKIDKYSYNTD